MDLTRFLLIRKPRIPSDQKPVVCHLEGDLVSKIAAELAHHEKDWEIFVAETHQWETENFDPLVWSEKEPNPPNDLRYIYFTIGEIDRWLSERADMPLLDDFLAYRDSTLQDLKRRFQGSPSLGCAFLPLWLVQVLSRILLFLLRSQTQWSGGINSIQSNSRLEQILASLFVSKPGDSGFLKEARANLCDWIAAELATDKRWRRICLLTRLLLVFDLLDVALVSAQKTGSGNQDTQVWDRLHRRVPVLPPQYFYTLKPRVDLVRGAKVADLFVVRSEWIGYLPSEVANIMNVLAGESFEQSSKKTDETETTTTEESESIQSAEESEQDKTQTEISREIERASSLQINADVHVNVSGDFGTYKFGTSANVAVGASLSENSRQASKLSRELVSTAISKVESRVREERIHRKLTRIEDLTRHEIVNKQSRHVNGIYRWVDRVDRYQVFRYPNRLLLEFEIPEPAEYYRWRLGHPTKLDDGVGPAPQFDVNASSIYEINYAELALKYRAANVPPPPDREVGNSFSFTGWCTQQAAESEAEKTFQVPHIEKDIEQTIGTGYKATSIKLAATATPFKAIWRAEGDRLNPVLQKGFVEGFHTIRLSISAGGLEHQIRHPKQTVVGEAYSPADAETKYNNNFSVQLQGQTSLAACDRSEIPYMEAFLNNNETIELTFTPAIRNKLSISVLANGAECVSVSGLIICQRTDESFSEWQNSVYDILLEAWRAWDQAYRTEQLQKGGAALTPINSTSPARNKEIVFEELKRQVIKWLLNDQGFNGLDAMNGFHSNNPDPSKEEWKEYDILKAWREAPKLQFLEQAFEWGNLTYMLYPYYWARGEKWNSLADLQGADPEFIRFLRAGSARVIVPARPGFDLAVMNWLYFQEPFMGDPLPLPGDMPVDRPGDAPKKDPLYVSIAQEVRDLTGIPEDGEPCDCWETRLGTSLLWLDPASSLPRNQESRLGKPPHEPKTPILKER